jgi:hypothetical protein
VGEDLRDPIRGGLVRGVKAMGITAPALAVMSCSALSEAPEVLEVMDPDAKLMAARSDTSWRSDAFVHTRTSPVWAEFSVYDKTTREPLEGAFVLFFVRPTHETSVPRIAGHTVMASGITDASGFVRVGVGRFDKRSSLEVKREVSLRGHLPEERDWQYAGLIGDGREFEHTYYLVSTARAESEGFIGRRSRE